VDTGTRPRAPRDGGVAGTAGLLASTAGGGGLVTKEEEARFWANIARRLLATDAATAPWDSTWTAIPDDDLRAALRAARLIRPSLIEDPRRALPAAFDLGALVVAGMVHAVANAALADDREPATSARLRAALVTVVGLEPPPYNVIYGKATAGAALAFEKGARSVIVPVRITVGRALAEAAQRVRAAAGSGVDPIGVDPVDAPGR
jgi:hypothetical protein